MNSAPFFVYGVNLDELRAPEPADEEEAELEATLPDIDAATLARYLDRIPPIEADIIELNVLGTKTQAELAAVFNCSQRAVSWRRARALRRIRFLCSVPELTAANFAALAEYFSREDRKLLEVMHATTSQSEAAKACQTDQASIRRRLLAIVARLVPLAEAHAELEPVTKFFVGLIRQNAWNLLRQKNNSILSAERS